MPHASQAFAGKLKEQSHIIGEVALAVSNQHV